MVFLKYGFALYNGAILPDVAAVEITAEALERAERFGDEFSRHGSRLTHGLVLLGQLGPQRAAGLELLEKVRDTSAGQSSSAWLTRMADTEIAREMMRSGNLADAIAMAREGVDLRVKIGEMIARGPAVTLLVEFLLQRGDDADLSEAQAVVDRLAAVPTDDGFVLHDLPLLRLRALLARARGDEAGYREFAMKYRKMANDLGFEGHMAVAAGM